MFRRLILMMLVLLILVPASMEVCLAEADRAGIVQPQYSHITLTNATISINNGTIQYTGTGKSRYKDTTTTIKVTLQKRAIGTSSWTTVGSWSDKQSGTTLVCVDKQQAVSRGYEYRIYVQCIISDAEGVIQENVGKYSNVVEYP